MVKNICSDRKIIIICLFILLNNVNLIGQQEIRVGAPSIKLLEKDFQYTFELKEIGPGFLEAENKLTGKVEKEIVTNFYIANEFKHYGSKDSIERQHLIYETLNTIVNSEGEREVVDSTSLKPVHLNYYKDRGVWFWIEPNDVIWDNRISLDILEFEKKKFSETAFPEFSTIGDSWELNSKQIYSVVGISGDKDLSNGNIKFVERKIEGGEEIGVFELNFYTVTKVNGRVLNNFNCSCLIKRSLIEFVNYDVLGNCEITLDQGEIKKGGETYEINSHINTTLNIKYVIFK